MPSGCRKHLPGCLGLGIVALILLVMIGTCNDAPDNEPTVAETGPPTPRIVYVTATPAITPTPSPTPAPTATPTPASALQAVVDPTLTPTPPPAPTPTARPTTSYTVQAGDTLSAIADRYGVDLDDLIAANEIDDPNLVTVGTVLEIPGSGSRSRATAQRTVRPSVTRRSPSSTMPRVGAIPEKPRYDILGIRDTSFGVVKRLTYRIQLTRARNYYDHYLVEIAQSIVRTRHTNRNKVNALAFHFYLPGGSTSGRADGVVEWAPFGD